MMLQRNIFLEKRSLKFKFCFSSHEIAEDANLSGCSFGEEGIDRYIMVYKKENPPSEDELAVLRRGEEWNEEKAKELAKQV